VGQSQQSGGASSAVACCENKMPAAAISAAGIHDFRDDVLMLLICPTRQTFSVALTFRQHPLKRSEPA
jgi:hypothetical protein